ncbi:histidine kinase [Jonesiaceae bacterium BS-20]|uniref:histidine kinase n=1 Tax=Jonesiaceae bacterium BS-20 TaxID=3120821 RepID=A0AAU7DVB2_9MICO
MNRSPFGPAYLLRSNEAVTGYPREDGAMMWQWWGRLEAKPVTRDRFIALAWGAVGLALVLVGLVPLWSQLVVIDLGTIGFIGTLLAITAAGTMRSSRPVLTLALGTAIFAADICQGGSPGVALIYCDLIYATVKYARSEQLQLLLRIATAATAGLGIYFVAARTFDSPYFGLAFQLLIATIVSAAWGWNVRSERSRTQTAMAAAFAEQTTRLQQTIAHDLHDLVGNQIAVAGLHIEAAKLQLANRDFDGLNQSLTRAKTGTDLGHRELRNLITVLSAVEAFQPPGTLDVAGEIQGLTKMVPGGRQLRWKPDACPALVRALTDQAPAQRRVSLRVLQELVANAVKHGRGDITVGVGGDSVGQGTLVIEVANGLASSPSTVPGTGIGMRGAEILVTSVAGTLRVHQMPDRWQVQVVIPTQRQELNIT